MLQNAADIIPGRPPVKALITAIEKRMDIAQLLGPSYAIIENAIASGKARATTRPANMSPRTFASQSLLNSEYCKVPSTTISEPPRKY